MTFPRSFWQNLVCGNSGRLASLWFEPRLLPISQCSGTRGQDTASCPPQPSFISLHQRK